MEQNFCTVLGLGQIVPHLVRNNTTLDDTCLRFFLNDFVHHHIEMACNLLETCGRYLFRSPDSHQCCKLLLEQMMRKKSLLPYDSRYMTTIENAYYFAILLNESQTIARHERPPIMNTCIFGNCCIMTSMKCFTVDKFDFLIDGISKDIRLIIKMDIGIKLFGQILVLKTEC
uniref:Uncharacterized protein n=1 Tax=Tetranychus urticae TaxID=32264 RepID=T1K5D5_TETUR